MHKEQPPVIRLLWANEKDLAQMPLSLRCVQYMVTISLQHQQYMFGVKSLLVVQKVLSLRNNLDDVLFRRPMQRSQRLIPSCGQTGVWWNKCLYKLGRYIEKWNINVWRLNTFACWTCSLFSMPFNTYRLQKKTAAVYYTDCVLSTSDVTVMTSSS